MQIVVSGTTDTVLHFTAPSQLASKLKVRYKRGNGTLTSMTTPGIAEIDQANIPGEYTLLMNQGTTISAGKQAELLSFYFYTDTVGELVPFRQTVCLVKNLPAKVEAVLGYDLLEGGASPASPIGVAE